MTYMTYTGTYRSYMTYMTYTGTRSTGTNVLIAAVESASMFTSETEQTNRDIV